MGGGAAELKGPDLREGVPLSSLREGTPFAAHADGEPVVVVRTGDEVRAIGATCTHYGGPLAEGLVVGDTIRCPWHHACFSLRTGEATGAPALNPVPRWQLEVSGGRVRATGREQLSPLDPAGRASTDDPATVVIIGAGAAGSAAAEQLRREGHTGRIIMVDPDEAAPYDRPNLSKDYLSGVAPEEWIPLRPEAFHEEHGIERLAVRVEAVLPDERAVRLADGGRLSFDALLLATGAAPIRLPVPGAELNHVHVLRSLHDCRRLIAAAESGGRVVVIGASFMGMEVAASLRTRGLDVVVVAPEAVPFERSLGVEIGGRIQAVHESHGVAFRLDRSVGSIGAGHVLLDDGTRLDADLVVVGIGVRPETGLAEAAGLAVDDGVVVNELLETSSPGIFAAGDIARWPAPVPDGSIRVEHWAVAQRLGQTAAANILGQRRRFAVAPFFWTSHFDLTVAFTGYSAAYDSVSVTAGDEGGLTARYSAADRVLAVATIGRDLESLRAEARLEAETRATAGAGDVA